MPRAVIVAVPVSADDVGPGQRVHPGEEQHEPVVGAGELVEQRASGGRGESENAAVGKPTGVHPPGGVGEDQPAGLIRHYLHTEHGVKVATTGRRYPVDPAAIREAITRRDTTRDRAGDPGKRA